MATRWGTSHFESRESAIRYYNQYEPGYGRWEVDRKLAEGEIHLGRPAVREGERVEVDRDGRYWVVEPSNRATPNLTDQTPSDQTSIAI